MTSTERTMPMTTATARRRSAKAPPPPVAHAPARLRRDWMPAETGVDWLDALAQEHRDAADEWARASHAVAAVGVLAERERAGYERAVYEAIRDGVDLPPRPAVLDEPVLKAQRRVALESVGAAERKVGSVIVKALTELRARRGELSPDVLDRLDSELTAAVRGGLEGGAAEMAAQLRARGDAIDPQMQHPVGSPIGDPNCEALDDEDPPNATEEAA